MNALDPAPDTAAFDCPRSGEAREVATADYMPKMNVTPNAVATKD